MCGVKCALCSLDDLQNLLEMAFINYLTHGFKVICRGKVTTVVKEKSLTAEFALPLIFKISTYKGNIT